MAMAVLEVLELALPLLEVLVVAVLVVGLLAVVEHPQLVVLAAIII
jgi:hypothetical protein